MKNNYKIVDNQYSCIGEDKCKDSKLSCGLGRCTINCFGKSACANSEMDGTDANRFTLLCGEDDQDDEDSCKAATITGGGSTTGVRCSGKSTCGDTIIDGSGSNTLAVECLAEDACKGNTEFICGESVCFIDCIVDKSCEDATITNPPATCICAGDGCDSVSSSCP